MTLTEEDGNIVWESLKFVIAYLAEFLPAHIVVSDAKPALPHAASSLAVRRIAGEDDYIGSFDIVLRLHCSRSSHWQQYNGEEVALDVKLTGASSKLGLEGPTMRSYIQHGRAVMKAARREKARIADCKVIAYLVRRPACPAIDGQACPAKFGFVAFDVEQLLQWEPAGTNPLPAHICMHGQLLQSRGVVEPEALPRALPRPAPRNRWQELKALEIGTGSGWVTTQDFCKVFDIGRGSIVHGASRVNKRVLQVGGELSSSNSGARGPPKKTCRIADLKQAYPDLS